jgi:hypothetical protein
MMRAAAATARASPLLRGYWRLQVPFSAPRRVLELRAPNYSLQQWDRDVLAEVQTRLATYDYGARGAVARRRAESECADAVALAREGARRLLLGARLTETPPSMRPTLPRALITNTEPYHQGEWRRAPYAPRDYETLTAYKIRPDAPRVEAEALRWKLSTRRANGCNEEFRHNHRAALGEELLGEREASLSSQVERRACLVPGEDVAEADIWGMDCYTRRNVFDAVVDSGAFAHLRRPGGAIPGCLPLPSSSVAAAATTGAAATAGAADEAAAAALKRDADSSVVPGENGAPPAASGAGAGASCPFSSSSQAAAAAAAAAPAAAPLPAFPPVPATAVVGRGSTNAQRAAQRQAVARAWAELERLPPTDAERDAAHRWIDFSLAPVCNRQGEHGWDVVRALGELRDAALARGDMPCARACAAVEARVARCGYPYFRLLPKGRGTVCARPEGIPAFRFVEEYLGDIHTGWRWFELQVREEDFFFCVFWFFGGGRGARNGDGRRPGGTFPPQKTQRLSLRDDVSRCSEHHLLAPLYSSLQTTHSHNTPLPLLLPPNDKTKKHAAPSPAKTKPNKKPKHKTKQTKQTKNRTPSRRSLTRSSRTFTTSPSSAPATTPTATTSSSSTPPLPAPSPRACRTRARPTARPPL